ncbi:MAG: acyl-CoA thioesterase [Sphingobium sp.]|nr:acyl-CoA thioesterase [Sphingobium sp.]MBP6112643.1 acyl-CoA thioesterase [Sphingobium sp.]MBP8669972.1 acyl-CoA thioesterase [Sphingobium sp.]MBP9158316.1 acyl-CoA thioesterase [Sphingobium sp.]MCC6482145.1 acyl-CoA thioesterase [Sphingomonadaceae bacterium]
MAPDVQPMIRVTAMPTDINPYGGVFGGWIMGQMALGAASLASRHSKGRAILVAASDFAFPAGMVVGEELSVYATLEKQGRSSMTISAQGWRRERDGDEACLTASGQFTFVAVDESNTPRAILFEQGK